MCLAIYKPKGIQLSKKWLKNGFSENEDGAGLSFVREGKIETQKGFFTFGEFWKAWKAVSDLPAVVHFRFATHGNIAPENCHPFELCGGKFAMVHNGILNIETTDEKSDSRLYAELILEPMLARNSANCPAFKFLVESAIGTSNKIILLHCDGTATIFNESKGLWKNGAWLSNDGCLTRPAKEWFSPGMFDTWRAKEDGIFERALDREAFPDYSNNAKDDELAADKAYYQSQGFSKEEISEIGRAH